MGIAEIFEKISELINFVAVGAFAVSLGLVREILLYGPENVIYKDGWIKKYACQFIFFCVMGFIFGIILK